MDNQFDYSTQGFNDFLIRSIDMTMTAGNLNEFNPSTVSSRILNYDQTQSMGQMGDYLNIGNIRINGSTGRISIFDQEGNEVGRIGELEND